MNQDHLDDEAEDARAMALAAAMADQHGGPDGAAQETAPHPYSALNPGCVLDALDSNGLRGDGPLAGVKR